jgi:hypothetical protein
MLAEGRRKASSKLGPGGAPWGALAFLPHSAIRILCKFFEPRISADDSHVGAMKPVGGFIDGATPGLGRQHRLKAARSDPRLAFGDKSLHTTARVA